MVAFRSAERRFDKGIEGVKSELESAKHDGKLTKELLSEIETEINKLSAEKGKLEKEGIVLWKS